MEFIIEVLLSPGFPKPDRLYAPAAAVTFLEVQYVQYNDNISLVILCSLRITRTGTKSFFEQQSQEKLIFSVLRPHERWFLEKSPVVLLRNYYPPYNICTFSLCH